MEHNLSTTIPFAVIMGFFEEQSGRKMKGEKKGGKNMHETALPTQPLTYVPSVSQSHARGAIK